MQYARNRELRATLHRAYSTRASELGARPNWDNTPVIRRILALRQEEARLLGYANYAEVSLVPKMAGSAAEVIDFLRELAGRRGRSRARDLARARRLRARQLGIGTLAAADLAFASETPEGASLRVLRSGGAPVLSRAPGLGGTVPRRRDAFRHHDPQGVRGDLASGRALLRDPRCRTGCADRPVLSRPVRAAGQAGGAWMDDGDRSPQRRRRASSTRSPTSSATLSAPVRGRAARSFTHDDVIDALPRVRARAAPAADARRRRRRVRHPRRRVGRGRAAQPVHGELLLGMGRARAR